MWTSYRIAIATAAAALSHLMIVSGVQAADNAIDTPSEIDKHFEEASKDFGNGVVQLHSRQDGADGTQHAVHQFDCVNGTYDSLYAGDAPPTDFPLDSTGVMGAGPGLLYDDPTMASLAQHTCTKYGHPLAEW